MLRASISVPPDAFALERAVDDVPELELEAERIAAHSTEWVMPCLWIAGTEFDAVDDALRSDPSVERIVDRERFDEIAFYHVEWTETVTRRIDAYLDKEGSLLEARLIDGEWRVELRFADRDQFDAFREQLADRGHSFRLRGLTEMNRPENGVRDLTPAQRDALEVATERGYFRVPREATTDDLADDLDISHQAVSELLRRGTENLVVSTLAVEPDSTTS